MDCTCFNYIGLASVTYITLKLLSNIIGGIKLYFPSAYPDFSKYGKWSVVTGATDGIGKASARLLAEKGQNVVLISRNAEKLKVTAADIERDFGVETRVIQIDFTQDHSIYTEIAKQVDGMDIGVLINNVGISYEYPEYFLKLPDLSGTISRMIRGNILSVVKMTEIILPGMVSRKRGLILNISSASALKPTPMLTLYSATKDFVTHFSRSISYEYEDKGVKIQAVMPFYVTTKLSKIRKSSLLVPSPEIYVQSMLKGAGLSRSSHGYWAHGLEGWAVSMVPEWAYAHFMRRKGESIRQRAYRKLREKKANEEEEAKKDL